MHSLHRPVDEPRKVKAFAHSKHCDITTLQVQCMYYYLKPDAFMIHSLVLPAKQVAQCYLIKLFVISVKQAKMITVLSTARTR